MPSFLCVPRRRRRTGTACPQPATAPRSAPVRRGLSAQRGALPGQGVPPLPKSDTPSPRSHPPHPALVPRAHLPGGHPAAHGPSGLGGRVRDPGVGGRGPWGPWGLRGGSGAQGFQGPAPPGGIQDTCGGEGGDARGVVTPRMLRGLGDAEIPRDAGGYRATPRSFIAGLWDPMGDTGRAEGTWGRH